MGKKQYKEDNQYFLVSKSHEPDVKKLSDGILYKELKNGDGPSPTPDSIVSVYYKGMLISGKVFDDNTDGNCAEALRLKDLIAGWQIALLRMHVGDKWEICIPSELGYGKDGSLRIPKNSTLIFEIELVGLA
ncbi:FKBP-type peptidyl-prolyl cis-trans isomerase [Xylanibacter oryzae]|uniref:FKBP-type peptidyl-prolyl cis-trans isomerase n=1 Tax=Xylanibacter oryzae TaxID=185293 RepID=UPI0004B9EF68|nr:FKBP-type peptidyl-prolyl cis-trans isomerase [Xylanibacter oryzae]